MKSFENHTNRDVDTNQIVKKKTISGYLKEIRSRQIRIKRDEVITPSMQNENKKT